MDLCYPVIATTAFFTLIFIIDLQKTQYKKLLLHFIYSIICILLITYLCRKGYTFIAWTLVIFPFILIFIGSFLTPKILKPLPSIPPAPKKKCAPGCPKPVCTRCSKKTIESKKPEEVSATESDQESVPAPVTCGPDGDSPSCVKTDTLPSV